MAWDDGHRRHSTPIREVIRRVEKPVRRSIQVPVEVEVVSPVAHAQSPRGGFLTLPAVPVSQVLQRPCLDILEAPCETIVAASTAGNLVWPPPATLQSSVKEPVLQVPAPARPVRPRARTLSPPKPCIVAAGRQPPICMQQPIHPPGVYLRRSGSSSGFTSARAAISYAPLREDVTGPPPRRTPSLGFLSYQPPVAVLPSPRKGLVVRSGRPSRASGCSVSASAAAAPADGPQEATPCHQRAEAVQAPRDAARGAEGWMRGARPSEASGYGAPASAAASPEDGPREAAPRPLGAEAVPPPREAARASEGFTCSGRPSRASGCSTPASVTAAAPADGPQEAVPPPHEVARGAEGPIRSGRPSGASGCNAPAASGAAAPADGRREAAPRRRGAEATAPPRGSAWASDEWIRSGRPSRGSGCSGRSGPAASADGPREAAPRPQEAAPPPREAAKGAEGSHWSLSTVALGTGGRTSSQGFPSLSTSQPPRRQVRPATTRISQGKPMSSGTATAAATNEAPETQPWREELAAEVDGLAEAIIDTHKARWVLNYSCVAAGAEAARSSSSTCSGGGEALSSPSQARPASFAPRVAAEATAAYGSCSSLPGSGQASADGLQEGCVGSWALSTIDEALARDICSAGDLAALRRLDLPFPALPTGSHPAFLGTWMVWMVHRVALDDPELTVLDFSTYQMPAGERERRIAPKLMRVLGGNTHLRELLLFDSNMCGGDHTQSLAESLAKNCNLRVLNISLNFLEPEDLRDVFRALAQNTALEVLKCSNQFCDQAGWEAYQALAEALKKNQTLRKLGMELTDAHWRDQINRGLLRNIEAVRKKRWEEKKALEQQQEKPAMPRGMQKIGEGGRMASAVARAMADAGGA
uniref:Uncharacterized protein n=1 Tax=Alexandrium monilatum TaxID=311494 RepID=A0A7S4VMX4_9DINO